MHDEKGKGEQGNKENKDEDEENEDQDGAQNMGASDEVGERRERGADERRRDLSNLAQGLRPTPPASNSAPDGDLVMPHLAAD